MSNAYQLKIRFNSSCAYMESAQVQSFSFKLVCSPLSTSIAAVFTSGRMPDPHTVCDTTGKINLINRDTNNKSE